jgi:hypothetical protein
VISLKYIKLLMAYGVSVVVERLDILLVSTRSNVEAAIKIIMHKK